MNLSLAVLLPKLVDEIGMKKDDDESAFVAEAQKSNEL